MSCGGSSHRFTTSTTLSRTVTAFQLLDPECAFRIPPAGAWVFITPTLTAI